MSSNYFRSMRAAGLMVIAAMLAACGQQRVVQEGWLKKRHLQRGWHVDLHRQESNRSMERFGTCEWQRSRMHVLRTPLVDIDERLMVRTLPKIPMHTSAAQSLIIPYGEFHAERTTRPADAPYERFTLRSQENTVPAKTRNRLAIPTLVLAVGTIALAFLTTSTVAVLLGCLITVVIGAVSLKQIRRREQSGKGFALIGFILGLIALLITAMAIAILGFV